MNNQKILLVVVLAVVVVGIVILVGRSTGEAVKLYRVPGIEQIRSADRVARSDFPNVVCIKYRTVDQKEVSSDTSTTTLREQSFEQHTVEYSPDIRRTPVVTYVDYCLGNRVQEWSCSGIGSNVRISRQVLPCSNGCVQGACLR